MRAVLTVAAILATGVVTAITLGYRFRGRGKTLGDSEIDPYAETPPPDDYDEEGEDDCLKLGKKHIRYGDPYRVCLTANQRKTLFGGQRPKKLGCGTFACAYESPEREKAIKLTRDSEDVAALLKAQKTGLVPKIYATYKLKQPGRTIPKENPITMRVDPARDVGVYALVVERLQPISREDFEEVDSDINDIREVAAGEVIGDQWCDKRAEDGYGGCSTLQLDVIRIVEKLAKSGIKWDDIHAGNIGYDDHGKLKVLDLGVTGTQLKRRLKILAGIQRAGKSPSFAGMRLV